MILFRNDLCLSFFLSPGRWRVNNVDRKVHEARTRVNVISKKENNIKIFKYFHVFELLKNQKNTF